MRIVVLSNMYPNSVTYRSGIFVHEQVKELIKLGIEVTVIAPIPYSPKIFGVLKNRWNDYSKVSGFETIDNVKVYHPRFLALPNGYLKGYWGYIYAITASYIIKKILLEDKIDLLHAHGSLPDDFGTYLLSKKFSVPYVITVHGASVYAVHRNTHHFKMSKIAIVNANKIVAVSNIVLKRIEKFTGRKEGVSCIYNGFKASDESTKSVLKDPSIIKILFAGSLIERKGIRYLISAFIELEKKYFNLKLIVAGGGILENEMMLLCKNFKIEKKVFFLGTISHKKMLDEIKNSDILVLPSWDEAFGVVYLEAMSMKKPVVGTINEGISDFITDGENGYLVEPRDSSSIIEKLSLLIENKKLRDVIGNKGFEAIKNLTWERNAIEYIALYNEILNEERNG